MTDEFEQAVFAYYRQQRASREVLHDALVLTEGQRDQARAERDALRTVYKAAAAYCGDRTVSNEHALIDAVGEIRALEVQP